MNEEDIPLNIELHRLQHICAQLYDWTDAGSSSLDIINSLQPHGKQGESNPLIYKWTKKFKNLNHDLEELLNHIEKSLYVLQTAQTIYYVEECAYIPEDDDNDIEPLTRPQYTSPEAGLRAQLKRNNKRKNKG